MGWIEERMGSYSNQKALYTLMNCQRRNSVLFKTNKKYFLFIELIAHFYFNIMLLLSWILIMRIDAFILLCAYVNIGITLFLFCEKYPYI